MSDTFGEAIKKFKAHQYKDESLNDIRDMVVELYNAINEYYDFKQKVKTICQDFDTSDAENMVRLRDLIIEEKYK